MERKNPEMGHPLKPILKLNNIEVMYHEVILVLKGVSIEVPQGGIVALLGANGAGKSTTLKSISGLLKHENGQVTDGSIEFSGERIDKLDAETIAQKGVFQVIEGRRVFQHLSVEENLKVGAHLRRTGCCPGNSGWRWFTNTSPGSGSGGIFLPVLRAGESSR